MGGPRGGSAAAGAPRRGTPASTRRGTAGCLCRHVDSPVGLQPPTPVGDTVGVAELEGAEVVGEGIEPHVDDLRRVVRHRNAPTAGPSRRTGHADVFESAGDEGEDLVAERLGVDCQFAGTDQPTERVLIAGEAEEPVRLGDPLDGACCARGSGRTSSGSAMQLAAFVEPLTADAVLAVVLRRYRSPLAAQARHSRSTAGRWRGSALVRRKSSNEMSSGSAEGGEAAALASTNTSVGSPPPRRRGRS